MGVLSIFAQELAHTMHGPVNDDGGVAGITPIPKRGEPHAMQSRGSMRKMRLFQGCCKVLKMKT